MIVARLNGVIFRHDVIKPRFRTTKSSQDLSPQELERRIELYSARYDNRFVRNSASIFDEDQVVTSNT